jgi:hypothetical protein
VDERSLPRRGSAAGDPFVAAAKHTRPCACLDGQVYVGHLVIGEDGLEIEVFEAYPCRGCRREEDDQIGRDRGVGRRREGSV